MRTIYLNTINEIDKLFHRKKTIVLLALSALIAVAGAVITGYFQQGLGITPVTPGDFPIYILGFFTNLFLPLFVFMAVADSFSGEQGERTLKTLLLRPISRFKVYASKIGAIGFYIVVNLGIVLLLSLATTLVLGGFGELAAGVLPAIGAYLVAVLPMLLLGMATAFVAQFFKGSSGALTISILAYMGAKLVSTLFPRLSDMVLTSYTDWHLLWINGFASSGRIFTVFMFILAYSIIFMSSGYLLFERKEM